MALVSLTPVQLNRGAESGDQVAGGTSVTTADTFEILCAYNDDVLIVIEEVGGGASTVTFNAGDNPPSPRQSRDADTVVLAASDLFLFVPEKGRHIQSDGTITGSVATNNVRIRAYRLPPGFVAPLVTYNTTNNS